MSYSLIYTPVLHFDDINGRPLVGGKLYTYKSGTSTPAQTYRNANGTELNENPILLNERGECVCFLDDGLEYKFVLKDSLDNTIWEQDNVSIPAGGGGSAITIAELPLRIVVDKITNNGVGLTCTGTNAWAEGDHTTASGNHAHAEGSFTTASGNNAHSEGGETTASGEHSHAEGFRTRAGLYGHAEGAGTYSNNVATHAEGQDTVSSGVASHAEGRLSTASGDYSHASGYGTRATGEGSTAVGKYNDDGTALFVVGNGEYGNRKDVFKVDSNGETWVNISGVLTKITSLGGIPIYPTLQDAITDQANLPVGTIFETNGFHTSGDGGAARYLVSNTGTANGMNIVSMGGGKLAIVQLKGSAYTEQIGYVVDSSQADVTPYIKRLLAMGIQEVKFYPTGSAPTKCYCIRDTLDLDRSDFHNVGVHLKGADIGQASGYATYFNFRPSVSNTKKIAIKVHARTTEIEDIILIYGAGASDSSVRGSSAGICFDSTGNQTGSYGAVIKNLVMQGFNTAILSDGTAPYVWHVDCEKVTFSLNNTHVSIDGLSYCTTFRNCLFNSPDVQSVYLGEPFTVKFDSCNFGIDDRATTIIRSVNWVIAEAPVDERFGSVLFTNCNMEVEYRNTSVPQNNRHLFFYADDDSKIKYELDNCTFIVTPLAREYVTTDRMVSLGSGSEMILRNSIGPYADVNYTGNEFYEKDYDKYFFDESRFPEKKVSSIRIENCVGIDPLVFLDSDHLPCLKKDDGVLLCDNDTDLTEFNGIGDGTTLFNLDTFIPYVKVAGKLQPCASAPSGVVRIGNELYDYVTIDGLKWITRNLNLRLTTRQHTIFGHNDWGQYYKYSDLSAVSAELPTGWRIPNATDIASIVGDGTSTRAHNLQSLGVSFWPSATDSTGFSALPSMFWYKPNTEPHPTYKEYALYWTTATEGTDVKNIEITPDSVSSGTFTSEDASTLWIPIRVCCDA